MSRTHKACSNWDELATIWLVSGELWTVAAPILAELDPPKPAGWPRMAAHSYTGAQWPGESG